MPNLMDRRGEQHERGGTTGMYRHSLYNLLGQLLPMGVAAITIPGIIAALGVERFALLSLGWALLASAVFFDFGIGRATTHFVARIRARSDNPDDTPVILHAGAADLAIGIILALVLQPLVDPLSGFLKVPEHLVAEARGMLRALAFSLPVLTVGGTMRAALEGRQQFALVNGVKGPFNALIFLIPAVGVVVAMTLGEIILLILASRFLLALIYGWAVLRKSAGWYRIKPSSSIMKSLFAYGGWVTVSNSLTPFLMFGERLLIPAILSIGVLTYYSAPFEIISRLAVIPFSMTLALFPRISAASTEHERPAWRSHVVEPIIIIMLILTPIVAIVVAFAGEILTLWLGEEFAGRSTVLLQLLALAFYANGCAHILLAAVQGFGRPDLKAKLDMVASVVLLVVGIAALQIIGLPGIALTKVLVSGMDAIVLYIFARRLVDRDRQPRTHHSVVRLSFIGGLFLLLSYVLHVFISPGVVKIGLFVAVLAASAWIFMFLFGSDPSVRAISSFLLGRHRGFRMRPEGE